MNTQINNELLARFLGFTKTSLGFFPNKKFKYLNHEAYYEGRSGTLEFHKSYDWIIPVVKKIADEYNYFWKIECIGINIYDLVFTQYMFEDADELELPEDMFEDADELELPEGLLIRTDGRVDKDPILSAMYKGCVEFVKWKSEQDEL